MKAAAAGDISGHVEESQGSVSKRHGSACRAVPDYCLYHPPSLVGCPRRQGRCWVKQDGPAYDEISRPLPDPLTDHVHVLMSQGQRKPRRWLTRGQKHFAGQRRLSARPKSEVSEMSGCRQRRDAMLS